MEGDRHRKGNHRELTRTMGGRIQGPTQACIELSVPDGRFRPFQIRPVVLSLTEADFAEARRPSLPTPELLMCTPCMRWTHGDFKV